tara:strand:- start:3305 stop:3721 length:417 start_codon:yes stop_codon:yes gene_type:complete
MFPIVSGVAMGQGPAALSIALDENASDLIIAMSPALPGGGNVDSNVGEIDVTATAAGGDGSYSYAWTVTETADSSNAISILAAGTQNAAQYDTLTLRIAIAALPGAPPNPGQYTLRCTVTDGAGGSVNDEHVVTVIPG